jgi:hypothetical protein
MACPTEPRRAAARSRSNPRKPGSASAEHELRSNLPPSALSRRTSAPATVARDRGPGALAHRRTAPAGRGGRRARGGRARLSGFARLSGCAVAKRGETWRAVGRSAHIRRGRAARHSARQGEFARELFVFRADPTGMQSRPDRSQQAQLHLERASQGLSLATAPRGAGRRVAPPRSPGRAGRSGSRCDASGAPPSLSCLPPRFAGAARGG